MSEESEADAHIRALLAELGSGLEGEEMPPAVAARLDDTLARLVAERGSADEPAAGLSVTEADRAEPGSAHVVPLRRRWVARTMAAAAAVIVLGAGGVTAADLLGSGGSPSQTASSAGGGTAGDTAPEGSSDAGANREGPTGKAAEAAEAIPRVSSASFAGDVTILLRTARSGLAAPGLAAPGPTTSGPTDPGQAQRGPSDLVQPLPDSGALTCQGPALSAGSTKRSVLYDGTPAVLVIHPVRQGRQLVEAWDCTGTRRVDAARVTP